MSRSIVPEEILRVDDASRSDCPSRLPLRADHVKMKKELPKTPLRSSGDLQQAHDNADVKVSLQSERDCGCDGGNFCPLTETWRPD